MESVEPSLLATASVLFWCAVIGMVLSLAVLAVGCANAIRLRQPSPVLPRALATLRKHSHD